MMSENTARGGRSFYGRGGRGRGRRGYSGPGRGRFAGRSNNPPSKQNNERELKFSPIQTQGKTPVATYATTKDALIQQIQKTYRGGIDVGKSLEDMKVVDLRGT